MARTILNQNLEKLKNHLRALGLEVKDNLVLAVDILNKRDKKHARELIHADKWVNEKRIYIVNEALMLIATQQPMAGDMRLIASIIEISGELERINDYAKGIAKISLMINGSLEQVPMTHLPEMAVKARHMLDQALTASQNGDAALARTIPATDDEVDALFNQTYQELITWVIAHPDKLEEVNRLEWAANLERAADRVINICEWVIYATTGKYKELDA